MMRDGATVYRGFRTKHGRCKVLVDDKPLRRRGDLRNHSPDGFEWGYGGSGPAQLALAMLADALYDELALRLYQRYKETVVCKWPKAGFLTTREEIEDWAVHHLGSEEGGRHGAAER